MRFIVHVGISLHHHLGGKQQNVVHVSVMYHVGIGLICKLAGECKCEFSLQSLVILEEYSCAVFFALLLSFAALLQTASIYMRDRSVDCQLQSAVLTKRHSL